MQRTLKRELKGRETTGGETDRVDETGSIQRCAVASLRCGLRVSEGPLRTYGCCVACICCRYALRRSADPSEPGGVARFGDVLSPG